jgi:hypothetical protein
MAPRGSHKGMAKAWAKMPTSVINQPLLLDWNCIMEFISEHILGLIQIYNIRNVKDKRACDLVYPIIILDPVMTRQYSQLQLMWLYLRSWTAPFREKCVAFCVYMGLMFDKTQGQRTIGGGTTPVPSRIQSIDPICRQPARRS